MTPDPIYEGNYSIPSWNIFSQGMGGDLLRYTGPITSQGWNTYYLGDPGGSAPLNEE